MKKISFNATESANSAIDELISSGFFTSKTDVLNTAILDLHKLLIEADTVPVAAEICQPSVSNPAVSEHSTVLKVQIVQDYDYAEVQNTVPTEYYWDILCRIVNGEYIGQYFSLPHNAE